MHILINIGVRIEEFYSRVLAHLPSRARSPSEITRIDSSDATLRHTIELGHL